MKNYAGFVYEWTNKLNGMKYLGSHKGNINDGYIGGGKLFIRAVKKYGIENFTREIVELVPNIDDIFGREEYYLKERDCANNPLYYNISPTAHGGYTGNSAAVITKISDFWEIITPTGEMLTIQNMRLFCKNNKLNPSAMSAVARGKKQHYKGYKCRKLTNNRQVDYEYQEWQSKGKPGKPNYGSDNGWSKSVEYDGIIYGSMTEACAATGLSMYLLRKKGKFDAKSI